MKKHKAFAAFLFICTICISGCGTGQTSDASNKTNPSEEKIKVIQDSDPVSEISSTDEEASGTVTEPETQSTPKKNILIALDPGHQGPAVDMSAPEPNAPGSDILKAKASSGTTGSFTGIPEYQLTLDISLMLRDRLISQGYDVILTRENNDTAISNAERACLANDAGADVSIRIHANGSESPAANGALMLIGSAENPYIGVVYNDSYRLAECILNSYCNATGMQNLGIQFNDTMTGLNWSQIPVVILEMGFMTNQQDDTNMADASYRESMVTGIVAGINAYYGF